MDGSIAARSIPKPPTCWGSGTRVVAHAGLRPVPIIAAPASALEVKRRRVRVMANIPGRLPKQTMQGERWEEAGSARDPKFVCCANLTLRNRKERAWQRNAPARAARSAAPKKRKAKKAAKKAAPAKAKKSKAKKSAKVKKPVKAKKTAKRKTRRILPPPMTEILPDGEPLFVTPMDKL